MKEMLKKKIALIVGVIMLLGAVPLEYVSAAEAFSWILEPSLVYEEVYYYDSLGWKGLESYDSHQSDLIDEQGNILVPAENTSGLQILSDNLYMCYRMNNMTYDMKYGIIDMQGNTVIPFEYESIGYVSDDFIIVSKDKNYETSYVIDIHENIVDVPFEYDNLYCCSDDSFLVIKDNKCGVRNIQGDIIIPMEYEDLNLRDNVFYALKDGKYGLLDMNGNIIVDLIYESIDKISSKNEGDYYCACKDGKYGLLDMNGNIIVDLIYESIDKISSKNEGDYYCACKDGKYGVINSNGDIIIPFEYTSNIRIICYNDNNDNYEFFFSDSEGKLTLINSKGKIIVGAEYNDIWALSDNLIKCRNSSGSAGVLNAEGDVVIPFNYLRIDGFSDDLFLCMKGGVPGAMSNGGLDAQGNIVIPFEYANLKKISDKYIGFEQNNISDGTIRHGVMDIKGNIIFSGEYQQYIPITDDLWIFQDVIDDTSLPTGKRTVYGIIDIKNDKELLPCEYDDISRLSDNLIMLKKDKKYGVIDKEMNIVFAIEYDYISRINANIIEISNKEYYGEGTYDYNLRGKFVDNNGVQILPGEYLGYSIHDDVIALQNTDRLWGFAKINVPEMIQITATAKNGTVTGDGNYEKGSEVTLSVEPNSGYDFAGWYVNNESVGTEPTYTFTAEENVNIEARFTRKSSGKGHGLSLNSTVGTSASFVVKFETDGGTNVSSQNVSKNTSAKEPTEPTKEGYVFKGWFIDKECTQEYDFNENINENHTLYAKWEKINDVDNKNEIVLIIGRKEAAVFGEKKTNDVAPIIRNNRTMLPARFVAEALGAEVKWNAGARKVTITKEDIEIVIEIDSDKAFVNGETVTLDSPAIIENDRTYTPIRFIAEKLGASVNWNEEDKKVIITKK